MSGPTREEAIEWGRQVGLLPDNSHPAPETRSMRMREDRIFALVRTAFAAGSRPVAIKAAAYAEDVQNTARLGWVISNPQSFEDLMEALWYESVDGVVSIELACARIDAAIGGNDA